MDNIGPSKLLDNNFHGESGVAARQPLVLPNKRLRRLGGPNAVKAPDLDKFEHRLVPVMCTHQQMQHRCRDCQWPW